jgi:tRNA dimethylallyltransferase
VIVDNFAEMTIGSSVPIKRIGSRPHHFIQNKTILKTIMVGDYEKKQLSN